MATIVAFVKKMMKGRTWTNPIIRNVEALEDTQKVADLLDSPVGRHIDTLLDNEVNPPLNSVPVMPVLEGAGVSVAARKRQEREEDVKFQKRHFSYLFWTIVISAVTLVLALFSFWRSL